jgi:hypothetical protein
MGKYDPLRDYLMAQPSRVKKIVLSISEVQDIINAPLPVRAWNEGVFWANTQKTQTTSQSAAWLKAGWLAHEDVYNERVRFVRKSSSPQE